MLSAQQAGPGPAEMQSKIEDREAACNASPAAHRSSAVASFEMTAGTNSTPSSKLASSGIGLDI